VVPVKFTKVVNAAGPFAADVARMAGIGVAYDEADTMDNSLRAALPVEKRKRYIYMIKATNGPLINCPLTIDSSGVFFRRHDLSNVYLCGLNQDEACSFKL
jgi:FAD-dependent oxidoreductase domain-containing protein 1